MVLKLAALVLVLAIVLPAGCSSPKGVTREDRKAYALEARDKTLKEH